MKKVISFANEDGLTRLQAVEKVQKGELLKVVAKQFDVHYTTIAEWVKMYNDGGIDRLNTYRKPRPKHDIDIKQLEYVTANAPEKYHTRLLRILRVEKGESLKKVAESEGVSVQYIMKDRRAYIAGKLPPAVST